MSSQLPTEHKPQKFWEIKPEIDGGRGFLGGSVVKTLPASAGDSDPWSGKIPRAAERLGLCTTTAEPVLWSPQAAAAQPVCCNFGLQLLMPACPRVCALLSRNHHNEKPMYQIKEWPCSLQLKKACAAMKTQHNQKKINRWWHLPGEEDWCRIEQGLVMQLC